MWIRDGNVDLGLWKDIFALTSQWEKLFVWIIANFPATHIPAASLSPSSKYCHWSKIVGAMVWAESDTKPLFLD